MEVTIEQKLKALYKVQTIDSNLDSIRAHRGELPLEVADLEDEIAGLETRLGNLNQEISEKESETSNMKISIKESQALIKKYEAQLNNVKNNREFDALKKETEIQTLQIQLLEKSTAKLKEEIDLKKKIQESAASELENRKADLTTKKAELDTIVEETQKEEDVIMQKRSNALEAVEDRLVKAYNRIRDNMRNGIAVARIERDSCSGCFASIPPQRQIDIKQRKKIIVCEHCGRVLVDSELADEVAGVHIPA